MTLPKGANMYQRGSIHMHNAGRCAAQPLPTQAAGPPTAENAIWDGTWLSLYDLASASGQPV
jgi:hypothetical protein